MGVRGRPEGMSDVEWLVALEEIRQLKARRDRYVDAHDWDGYESLHAPDHVSHHAPDHTFGGNETEWTSSVEVVKNLRAMAERSTTNNVHQSHGYEITFETPTKARGIWAMTGAHVGRHDDGTSEWEISFGYYYETYEKRDGEWLFTTRRWHRYVGMGSEQVIFPVESLKGTDGFSVFEA